MRKKPFRPIVLSLVALTAALLPVAPASSAPVIKLLNPSHYSGDAATLRISTKQDAQGNAEYHLVAWVSEVPSNPLVEFEIGATPGIPGQPNPGTTLATVDATRVGTDTFEGFLSTATIADGQYFLRAILYSGFTGPGTGSEVARDEQPVTIQSTQATASNTVEMTYPLNGGPFGFWKAGSRAGVGVVAGSASPGTRQVRVLFTTTGPGNDPDWKQCGFGAVSSDNSFRVRCTLPEATSPSSIRAIAAVANQTPPPAPTPENADETGDAHRVVPYLQNPTTVTFDPASATVDQNKCTSVTLTVRDQSGIPVTALNVDVHATGPDDQLRFATSQTTSGINDHDPFQAPDAAHTGNEPAFKCHATAPDNRQGEHSVPGGDDQKHIESTPNGGTDDSGQFRFFMMSGGQGGTQITAWGDENDDDNANAGEATGGAQLGWGEAPPPVATVLNMDPSSLSATVGDCERVTLSATQNGSGQAGKNVDIHISGPAGVSFCNPGDSGTSPPDSGGHAGDSDPGLQNTHHAEGTTNTSGQLIFGVTSSESGDTSISAWLDDNNSDTVDANENGAAGTIEWQAEGGRSISIRSNKKSVPRGSRVALSGEISGSDECSNGQTVKIQAQRNRRFRSIKTVATDNNGNYSTKVRVRKTKKYRALAPKNGNCDKAVSNTIRVRAT